MSLTAREIQPAIQATAIYIIMALIDQDVYGSPRGPSLIWTWKVKFLRPTMYEIFGSALLIKLQLLSLRFRDLIGGEYFSYTEQTRPSLTWEDWVFAESQRR